MTFPVQTIAAPDYSIHVGNDVFSQFESFLKRNRFSSIFVLADENTLQHCLPMLVNNVKKLAEAEVIELESGERNKTIDVCQQVWRVLGELGADRYSLFVNLGGGVITDMGGFIASTFKRGIAFVNVPTTLLAQVDASVGGKTGVDLDGLKNEIGVFAHAKETFIYPGYLKTLPARELKSGFAEVMKHGLIADKEYWKQAKNFNLNTTKNWEEIIMKSVRIKSAVVEEDPVESGKRKVLNFGHTIGHAIETYFLEQSENLVLHGEAVAAGMICEAWISNQKAKLSEAELRDISQAISERFGLLELDETADHRLIELMRHDKKNSSGQLQMVLLDAIGKPVYNKEVHAQEILEALNYYRFLQRQPNSRL